MTFFLFAVAYIVCSVLAFGVWYGDFLHNWYLFTERQNRRTALAVSIFGPISLMLALLFTGFATHGVKWRLRERQKQR